MSKILELDALIISMLATAILKIAYGLEQMPVLVVINVILAGVIYWVLKKNENTRKNRSKEWEEKLLQSIINNTNEIYNVNKALQGGEEQLSKTIETISKKINLQIEEQSAKISSILESFQGYANENEKYNNVLIETISKASSNFEVKIQKIDDLVLETKESNQKLSDITKNLVEQLDQTIDIHTTLKSLDNKEEESIKALEDMKEIMQDLKGEIASLKKTTKSTIGECIESNEKIVDVYSKIHQSSLEEMLKLANKNECLLSLLQDNYKVLKEVAYTSQL